MIKFSKFSLKDIDKAIKSASDPTSDNLDNTANFSAATLTYTQQPSASDANTLFYISGYIGRSICRKTGCECCREAPVGCYNLELPEIDVAVSYVRNILFDSVNRGGLKTPSEFLFMLTVHCWTVYEEIRSNTALLKQFRASESHGSLFFKLMDRATCHDSVVPFGLNSYMCTNGHDLMLVVKCFFNCVAKNLVKDMTTKANPQNGPLSKRWKIDKLSSNSQTTS